MSLPPEFAFIARHFRPLAGPGALGLADDTAVFDPPPGRSLVVAADAMVQGVHFLPDDPGDLVGRKLLRVNLSDLAAMGATPLGYLLTLSVPPGLPDDWFAAFGAGLAADQQQFGLSLLGGDTTSTTGPLVLSLTILGHVAPGAALRRCGAQPGDGIWVTGTIGDGALGLDALQGRVPDPDGVLADRYHLPRPRLGLGLAGVAHAAMDVSDGLVQDLGHLARESGLAAEVFVADVPVSAAAQAARAAAGAGWRERVLAGGDDYELLLAVPESAEQALGETARRAGVAVTRIGRFQSGAPSVTLRERSGAVLPLERAGWSHF